MQRVTHARDRCLQPYPINREVVCSRQPLSPGEKNVKPVNEIFRRPTSNQQTPFTARIVLSVCPLTKNKSGAWHGRGELSTRSTCSRRGNIKRVQQFPFLIVVGGGGRFKSSGAPEIRIVGRTVHDPGESSREDLVHSLHFSSSLFHFVPISPFHRLPPPRRAAQHFFSCAPTLFASL